MPDYKKNQGILNGPSADDATLQGAIGGALGAVRPAIPSPAREALATGAVGGRRQQREPSQRDLFRRYAAEERSPELLNLLYADKDRTRGSLYATEEEFQADYQSWLAEQQESWGAANKARTEQNERVLERFPDFRPSEGSLLGDATRDPGRRGRRGFFPSVTKKQWKKME